MIKFNNNNNNNNSNNNNLCQMTRHYNIKNKKKTFRIVDFAVLDDHRVKLKHSEKKDMYLDLARELKNSVDHNVV